MEAKCIHCDGKGTVLDVITYKPVSCPTCLGSCYVEAVISNYKDCIAELEAERVEYTVSYQRQIRDLEAELEYLKAEKRHFMANLERQAVYVSKETLYKFWSIAEKAAKRFTNYREPQGSEDDCFNCDCEECQTKTKAKEG